MTKQKKYGVANIVAQPHPPGTYIRLFEEAAKIGEGVQFYGDHFARLSRLLPGEDGIYRGRLAVWTEIDQKEPIIFKDSLEQALLSNTGIEIPGNIGFNSKLFYFAFRERDHLFFVELENDEGGSISVGRVVAALNSIFEKIVIEEIDNIEVFIKTSKNAVDKVLGTPGLRKVRIVVNIPNPDDLHDGIKSVFERMRDMHVKRLDNQLTKMPGADIILLDQYHLHLSETAKDNGFVEGVGRDANGEVVERSTKDHPEMISIIQQPEEMSFITALHAAREF